MTASRIALLAISLALAGLSLTLLVAGTREMQTTGLAGLATALALLAALLINPRLLLGGLTAPSPGPARRPVQAPKRTIAMIREYHFAN